MYPCRVTMSAPMFLNHLVRSRGLEYVVDTVVPDAVDAPAKSEVR